MLVNLATENYRSRVKLVPCGSRGTQAGTSEKYDARTAVGADAHVCSTSPANVWASHKSVLQAVTCAVVVGVSANKDTT